MTIHKDILSLQAKLRTALIKGHYKYISRDNYTAKVEVSGIALGLWLTTCAPEQNFKIWTASDEAILAGVFTCDEERLSGYNMLMKVLAENGAENWPVE